MRTFSGILLLAASLWAGWYVGKQRAEHAESLAAAEARAREAQTDGSEIVAASEAWKRYRETLRLGVRCEGDVGPHPLAVAAALGVVAWYVLRAGMMRRGEATPVGFGAR